MTREEFAERWQQQHYPTMDLRAEVPFYYYISKDLLRCERWMQENQRVLCHPDTVVCGEHGTSEIGRRICPAVPPFGRYGGTLVWTDGVGSSNSECSEDDSG